MYWVGVVKEENRTSAASDLTSEFWHTIVWFFCRTYFYMGMVLYSTFLELWQLPLWKVSVALTSCMDIQRLPCFWFLTMRHKEFCPLFSLNMLVSLFLIFQILFLTSSILAWDLMQTCSWFNSLRREFATLACRETVKII